LTGQFDWAEGLRTIDQQDGQTYFPASQADNTCTIEVYYISGQEGYTYPWAI